MAEENPSWIPTELALPLEGTVCHVRIRFGINTFGSVVLYFMQGKRWFRDDDGSPMEYGKAVAWRYFLEPVDSSGLVLATRETTCRSADGRGHT
jgi:hypothetical protein